MRQFLSPASLARIVVAAGCVVIAVVFLGLYGVGLTMSSVSTEFYVDPLSWLPAIAIALGYGCLVFATLRGHRIPAWLLAGTAWLLVPVAVVWLTNVLSNLPYTSLAEPIAAIVGFSLYAVSATYLAARPQKTSIRDVAASIGGALVVLVVVWAVARVGSAGVNPPEAPVDWHGGPDPNVPWEEQVVWSLYEPGLRGTIDRLGTAGDCAGLYEQYDTYDHLLELDRDGRHNYLMAYIGVALDDAQCDRDSTPDPTLINLAVDQVLLETWKEADGDLAYQVIVVVRNPTEDIAATGEMGSGDYTIDDLEEGPPYLVWGVLDGPYPPSIDPGGQAYYFATDRFDVGTDAASIGDVVPDTLVARVASSPNEAMEASETRLVQSSVGDGLELAGRVTNTTSSGAETVTVAAVLFDAEDQPIGAICDELDRLGTTGSVEFLTDYQGTPPLAPDDVATYRVMSFDGSLRGCRETSMPWER